MKHLAVAFRLIVVLAILRGATLPLDGHGDVITITWGGGTAEINSGKTLDKLSDDELKVLIKQGYEKLGLKNVGDRQIQGDVNRIRQQKDIAHTIRFVAINADRNDASGIKIDIFNIELYPVTDDELAQHEHGHSALQTAFFEKVLGRSGLTTGIIPVWRSGENASLTLTRNEILVLLRNCVRPVMDKIQQRYEELEQKNDEGKVKDGAQDDPVNAVKLACIGAMVFIDEMNRCLQKKLAAAGGTFGGKQDLLQAINECCKQACTAVQTSLKTVTLTNIDGKLHKVKGGNGKKKGLKRGSGGQDRRRGGGGGNCAVCGDLRAAAQHQGPNRDHSFEAR